MANTIKVTGQAGVLMGMAYQRLLPHQQVQTVGSFFFLDHFYERHIPPAKAQLGRGTGAHPHRGISTVTYVIKGENEHLDSLGNQAVVRSGGVQWMRAGRGIVHDEGAPSSFLTSGGDMHMMQFWVVLGDEEREDPPSYLPLQSHEVPEVIIDEAGSKLRVLIGNYCSVSSVIPVKIPHFLYHLHLAKKSEFYYTLPTGAECAVMAAKGGMVVNDQALNQSQLFVYKEDSTTLKLENVSDEPIEVMLFGGVPFDFPIYSQGPFVMGSREGLKQAYEDFYAGMYGDIKNEE